MNRFVKGAILLLATGLSACGGCENTERMDKEGRRLWGRERLAEEVQVKAKEPIDAYLVGERPDLKSKVLTMRYEEAVARMGFIEYHGTATFDLQRNGNRLRIVEETTIQHGLHGSFRIEQKDADGAVTRETIFNAGILYARNGPGKMRVMGAVQTRHLELLDEVWQPLRVYTSYYGPRVGLEKQGAGNVKGRGAAKYRFTLLDGSPMITVPGMKGAKRPKTLSGELFVDEATGVPIKGKLKGRLEIPPPKADQQPGVLDLTLNFVIKPIEGVEIRPKDFIPTIKHRPVDLDPLAFLDGGTRTSTIIGGK